MSYIRIREKKLTFFIKKYEHVENLIRNFKIKTTPPLSCTIGHLLIALPIYVGVRVLIN